MTWVDVIIVGGSFCAMLLSFAYFYVSKTPVRKLDMVIDALKKQESEALAYIEEFRGILDSEMPRIKCDDIRNGIERYESVVSGVRATLEEIEKTPSKKIKVKDFALKIEEFDKKLQPAFR